jgi:carbohydrate-binding DOMON domain-containing protein
MNKLSALIVSAILLVPGAFAQLGPTDAAPTIDGDPSDWGPALTLGDYVSNFENTGGATVNRQWQYDDPVGDDDGDGDYTYPTNAAWSSTEYDIDEFRLAYDSTNLYVMAVTASPDADFFGGFAPGLYVFIDRAGVGPGSTTTTVGQMNSFCRDPDLAFGGGFAFDFALDNRAGFDGVYHYVVSPEASNFPGNAAEGESIPNRCVEMSIPWADIGGAVGAETLDIVVGCYSVDGANVREIDVTASGFLGGGSNATDNVTGTCPATNEDEDADVYDLVGSANAAGQLADLATGIPHATITNSIISISLDPTIPVELSVFGTE